MAAILVSSPAAAICVLANLMAGNLAESKKFEDLRSSSRICVPVSTDAVAIDASTEQDASG
nr:hypothetical protein [Actinopolymorpha alba]